jgi:hypothetical protein
MTPRGSKSILDSTMEHKISEGRGARLLCPLRVVEGVQLSVWQMHASPVHVPARHHRAPRPHSTPPIAHTWGQDMVVRGVSSRFTGTGIS